MNSGKHYLLICVSSQGVINFRSNLIKSLIEKGNSVSIISFDDIFKEEIIKMGCSFYVITDNNRSLSPFKILSLKHKYKQIIKKVNPDVVFTFMLKPNIFGVLAARDLKIDSIFSMVEGVGDSFINKGIKWSIIRFFTCFLYKKALKFAKKVFFLNDCDIDDFVNFKLVSKDQCVRINGIGIDLDKFSYREVKSHSSFLMVARLLKTKGVLEYCECARKVKLKYPNSIFSLLGAEGSIKIKDIQSYIDDSSIVYLGTTKDVRPFLEDASVLVLPSYREGMPVSIMEAEAIGRLIVTTDVPGCRDTVVNDYNGFIVEKQNVDKLAEKIMYILDNPQIIKKYGINSRIFAEENFDYKKINEKIIEVISE